MTVSSGKTPSKIRRICPSVLLSLSFALYLALALCIIFTSLAFQKSYLYESCIAAALVSLPLLGYETGASQPPHARLSLGSDKFTKNPLCHRHAEEEHESGTHVKDIK